MKIALVFVGLLGLIVLGLPLSITGESSLSDAVQSFMSYGLNATGVLLGLLTIFLSRSMADEMVGQQIFLVLTKPVPRWQYIFGKWLGIMILNFFFLFGSGLTIYGMVHYIKKTHQSSSTMQAGVDHEFEMEQLNSEVLVARHSLKAQLPDFTRPARLDYERNREDGLYDDALNFNEAAEVTRLALKHEMRWRVVGPEEMRIFEFSNVLCDRSPDNRIQIRYKTNVPIYAPDEVYKCIWRFGDASKGTPVYQVNARHMIDRFHTLSVPADAVASDNTLTVFFQNEDPSPQGEPFDTMIEFRRADEVTVLFIVGSFEWNFVRLLVLMMCKLSFLAAVALLMTTVFSFPVACLASFTVYVLAATRSFILDALDFASDDYATMFTSFTEFFLQAVMQVYGVVHWVIPDFSQYDAVEDFVNGQNVSLAWVLNGIVWLFMVKTVLILGFAILLFHRREVAETSF